VTEKLTPDGRVALLEARLGLGPSPGPDERPLLLMAITHKSYVNEHPGAGAGDNERLEFLGDAVVDLAISHRLMERFPRATEGELSKLRARLVSEEALARVARSVGLGDLLLLGRGEELTGGREKSSVLGDALEAVIGAVYLAGGLVRVMELVDRHFGDGLAGVADGRNGLDYKTLLQEGAQERLKLAPRYKVVSESGPDHDKTFEVEVAIGEETYARAAGKNKKEAEQAAARRALERLSGQEPAES
jgi:ribonuclease-3